MKKLFLILLPIVCQAQIKTYTTTIKNYGTCNVAVYTPSTPAPWPAMIFIPGKGEETTDVTDLYKYGPLYFITQGWRPDFMVIGIQPPKQPHDDFVSGMMTYLLQNSLWDIDGNRVCLTGLSFGANAVYEYVRTDPAPVCLASVIVMSYELDPLCGDFATHTDYLCGADSRWAKIPTWGFCGSSDSFYSKMYNYFTKLIAAGYPTKFTTMGTDGHCCWNDYYNPSYKENGQSIYDWMGLQSCNKKALPIKFEDIQLKRQ